MTLFSLVLLPQHKSSPNVNVEFSKVSALPNLIEKKWHCTCSSLLLVVSVKDYNSARVHRDKGEVNLNLNAK